MTEGRMHGTRGGRWRTGLLALALGCGAGAPGTEPVRGGGPEEPPIPIEADGSSAEGSPGEVDAGAAGDAGAPEEPGAAALGADEVEGASAFVERLIEYAHLGGARVRQTTEAVDFEYIGRIRLARLERLEAEDEDRENRAWVAHLQHALDTACPTRPFVVQRYRPDFADGYFEPATLRDAVDDAALSEAFEAIRRALESAVVVSPPCDPGLGEDGFELLIGRDEEGSWKVLWLRRIEGRHGMRV